MISALIDVGLRLLQEMFKAKKCYVCGLNFEEQKALERHLVKSHRELLTPQKFKNTKPILPTPTGLFQVRRTNIRLQFTCKEENRDYHTH